MKLIKPFTNFTDPEEIKKLKKYEYSLLEAVEELHIETNWPQENTPKERVAAIAFLIKNRIASWELPSSHYDDRVMALANEALIDYWEDFIEHE